MVIAIVIASSSATCSENTVQTALVHVLTTAEFSASFMHLLKLREAHLRISYAYLHMITP